MNVDLVECHVHERLALRSLRRPCEKHTKCRLKIKTGSKVLIVEDVITTGKSSLECAKLVNSYKAKIVGYACIIDRSNGKSKIKEKIVSQVELNIPTYNKENLPKELLSIEAIKPGSRNL